MTDLIEKRMARIGLPHATAVNVQVEDYPEAEVTAIYYDLNTLPIAAIFFGKRTKAESHTRFQTAARRDEFVAASVQTHRNWLKAKADYKAKQKAENVRKLVVGDILVSSWGYEQTNIDYYQVTKLVGKASVEITPIGQRRKETAFMQGTCEPKPSNFIGEPIRKRVQGSDHVKITSYSYAWKWDGRPRHWSSYA